MQLSYFLLNLSCAFYWLGSVPEGNYNIQCYFTASLTNKNNCSSKKSLMPLTWCISLSVAFPFKWSVFLELCQGVH